MAGYVFEAQYNDARATHPDLTDPRDIYQNINWWVFNSFGGPTLNESDIDPETGAPTVYKGHKLFNALRSGQVLTLRNGDKVERWDPNVYLQDYLYGQATSQKHSVSISGADDKFSYRASLGYANNNSQLKVAEDGEKKYSARLNADYQALDFLKLETNMAYEKEISSILQPMLERVIWILGFGLSLMKTEMHMILLVETEIL